MTTHLLIQHGLACRLERSRVLLDEFIVGFHLTQQSSTLGQLFEDHPALVDMTIEFGQMQAVNLLLPALHALFYFGEPIMKVLRRFDGPDNLERIYGDVVVESTLIAIEEAGCRTGAGGR